MIDITAKAQQNAIDVFTRTNAQFREAVDDGLYNRPELWTSAGWLFKETNKLTKPGCWGDDSMAKFNGDAQPVGKVSWHESFSYLI